MTFLTQIPIEECKSRLAAGIDTEKFAFTWSGYAGSKPILGKLHGNDFRLQKRRYYKNDLARHFFGRFVTAGRDTRIEGEFRIRPIAKYFVIGWFSFLGLMLLITLVVMASGGSRAQGPPAIYLLGFPAMAAFGFAIVRFSRWLGRGEERAIVAFLKSTLEAKDGVDRAPIE